MARRDRSPREARAARAPRRRYEWPADGPRPGDPASDGPRPRGTVRDATWLAFTAVLLAVTTFQLVRLAWTLATSDDIPVTGVGAFLGFAITVVWLLTIYWLAAGAWRRSVWGCPFAHTEDAPWERRCQRHALLPTVDDGGAGASTPSTTATGDEPPEAGRS